MLRSIPLERFAGIHLVPQAIIRKPISYFHDALGIDVTPGHDDLDEFEGAFLSFNGEWPFALRHYRGHPDDTTTVYLLGEYEDLSTISAMVLQILRELNLSADALQWQRSDNPQL